MFLIWVGCNGRLLMCKKGLFFMKIFILLFLDLLMGGEMEGVVFWYLDKENMNIIQRVIS